MSLILSANKGKVNGKLWLFAACLLLILRTIQAAENDILMVHIEGVEGRLLDNVQVHLSIMQLADEPVINVTRLRWLHARAEDEIRRALQPFGYYQPRIDTELEHTPQGWQARYRIAPGEPMRITQMDVQVLGEGREDPAFQRALAALPLAKGEILDHPRYENIKRALQALAAERGYFDARMLTSEIRVDLQAYQAAIVLHFDTGRRYRLGQVTFHQDILAPEFLRRYSRIQPGDPYQIPLLLELQSALIDSAYFRHVEVAASPDRADNQTIPVDVYLEPNKRQSYTLGLGYGTDTGVRARAGLERRWVNRRGHRFRAELLASEIRLALSAEYVIPGAYPRTDQFVLRTALADEDSPAKDTRTAVVGVSRQRQRRLWQETLSLDFQREQFRFGDIMQTTSLLMPSAIWTRVDVDNRLRVTRGSRLSLELRGASEELLSDVSFLQAAVRGRWIRPLTADGRILLRGELGTSLVSEFAALPATVRFFAGGDRSVRGYSLESIGPRDAQGNVIGGKHLLVGSVEYEHRIRENWSVAAFVDSGDAFDDTTPDLKTGVGVGVRWQSPVGPVRVDVASGLDEPGDTVRLHLTIGPDL